MKYYGIATDRVRYVGEPVAIVCATDRYKAEDAMDVIEVDYEPLPAVVDPVEATSPEACILHPGRRLQHRVRTRLRTRYAGPGV